MKKLLGILLILVFAVSIYFTVSNDIVAKANNSSGYASIIPIPPSEQAKKVGM